MRTLHGDTYSIQVAKKSVGYEWTSKIVHDKQEQVLSSYSIDGVSSDFSAKKLADSLSKIKSNQDSEDLKVFYTNHLKFKTNQVANSTPPSLVFLALPIAVAGLTEAAILALEAVMIITLAVSAYNVASDSLREKKNTSDITYAAEETPIYVPYWGEFVAGNSNISLETKANKHMEEAIVTDVHSRIRNYGNESNTQIFASTRRTNNIMVVIDINSSMGGIVNRHLGNYVDGARTPMDANFKNEWMDLSGYSIFLIYNRTNKSIFHAHFTPKRLRNAEIEYNRYLGEFDLKIYPSFSQDSKYTSLSSTWESQRKAARNNRGLLLDTKGNRSVIPYK
ncbi:hypothetical protein [Tumebacillus flagellatus]|uniref:Uncharacterized protein n=1 Tax=Tumebacillus flagellatus TaxID=1157490 RepID=A0A074LH29_9BACL|nr:hypothetical protein [Tumebacillus flagellatus]KEO81536.1 hypothetical protein EL26_20265 [Tumebacillus flagellatus]